MEYSVNVGLNNIITGDSCGLLINNIFATK